MEEETGRSMEKRRSLGLLH